MNMKKKNIEKKEIFLSSGNALLAQKRDERRLCTRRKRPAMNAKLLKKEIGGRDERGGKMSGSAG